jgi:signal peptidase complex subunit 2
MAKKPASNGSAPSSSSPEPSPRPLGPLSVLADKEKLKHREEDVTKINNMNPSDLKNACDDALKRVCFTSIASGCFVATTELVFCP